MIIILAVLLGYILGIAPFITPKVIELIKERTQKIEQVNEDKEQKEIFDEWLNGVNQQDIYKEYVTGEETTKGE